jgi:acetoin utilization protein AcuB
MKFRSWRNLKELAMLVKYWMRKTVLTIGVDESVQEAARIMKEHSTPILPVLRKDELLGVVTDSDLRKASASNSAASGVHEVASLLSPIQVSDVMTNGAVTVRPDFTLEEAANVLLENNVPGAPVVDEVGQLKGIISCRDIFQALVSLSGLKNRGVQFGFEVDDRPGSIKELTDVIRAYRGRLISILTSYHGVSNGRRHVYIRAYLIDRDRLQRLRKELEQKGKLLYLVDHREAQRHEYVARDH